MYFQFCISVISERPGDDFLSCLATKTAAPCLLNIDRDCMEGELRVVLAVGGRAGALPGQDPWLPRPGPGLGPPSAGLTPGPQPGGQEQPALGAAHGDGA